MSGARAVALVTELLTPHVSRARPWHAGPEATARDLAALRFVGEQYAARSDVLAVLLGRLSPATVREPGPAGATGPSASGSSGGRQAGWAERRRMLGHTWVLPTRAGLRLAGLDLDPWTPAVTGWPTTTPPRWSACTVSRCPVRAAGCASGSCGAAAAGRAGTWPTAPCPRPCRPAGRGSSEAWELVEVELTQKARPRAGRRAQDPAAAHRRHHLLRPRRPACAAVGAARQRGAGAGRPPPGRRGAAAPGARRHLHGGRG